MKNIESVANKQNWTKIIPLSELPPGAQFEHFAQSTNLLLINENGKIHALENNCPHQHLPLYGGEVENGSIICAFHGAQFCLKTGAVQCAPAYEAVKVFSTRLSEEGWVEVNL
ncbi:MAG: Rieske (2Fe-2S) protein [Gammaproteobacteria bacterium]